MAISKNKKLAWFDLGATAFERQFPGAIARQFGTGAPLMYVCPVCRRAFTREAVSVGQLTAEHVPPHSFGGRELVLTCRKCNNDAGTILDAHARRKHNVLDALGGTLEDELIQKVKVHIGDERANARLRTKGKDFRLEVLAHVNPPGTDERVKAALTANGKQPITIEFSGDAFAELGAKISFLRAGYLVLFSVFGYSLVFDQALDVVRRQILEPGTALMKTFSVTLTEPRPLSERRIVLVTAADRRCWAVIFGRTAPVFPHAGDTTFYDRLSSSAGTHVSFEGRSYEWSLGPTFGAVAPTETGEVV